MAGKELVPPGLAYLADNVLSKHNILGAAKESRGKWAKNLNLSKETDTIFFAGCGYQYTAELDSLMGIMRKADKSAIGTDRLVNIAGIQKKLGINAAGLFSKVVGGGKDDGSAPLKDAVHVLNKLGIEFGYLGADEPCCGGILYFAGLHKEFARNSQTVYDELKSAGVKRIISIVPSCTYTLRNLISESVSGYDIEVQHFLEVVSERISSVNLRFPQKVKAVYHDPCQLSRFLDLIEEPRKILRAVEDIEFIETDWTNSEWSSCCGGGGGFEAVFPELSHILAVNRVNELIETGAEIIVTNCPGCIMQLKAGLKELKRDDIEVLDLAQVVAMAVGD